MKFILILFIPLLLSAGELMKLANAKYSAGDFTAAITLYRDALRAEENPPITHFNIANCYFQLDSLPQALVHYESTIELAPEFFRAYLNAGTVYFNQSQFGKAVALLERARIEEPNNKIIIQILAAAYSELKRYDHAVPLLQQSLENNPDEINSYFRLAEIMIELEDFEEAVEWLEKYPDSGARCADKYFLLADIAEDNEEYGSAIYYLNQYISISREDKWPHYKVVQLMEKQKHPLSAIYKAEETLELFPKFSDVALLGGNIAYTEKQFSLAEKLYFHAYTNGHSGGVVGLSNLRTQYIQQENSDGAIRVASYLSK